MDITKNFEELNLSENLLKGIYLYGFTKPSKIQIIGIKSIITGKDCILQSQSGTGKTATYLLGVLNRIDVTNPKCQGIIITPTRELSEQVYNVAISLSKFTGINICKCIGGTNIYENKELLKKAQLVIGTLGRLSHMIKEKKILIFNLKILVIDEADDIFHNGRNEMFDSIYSFCPDAIQCIMISATLSPNIFNISKEIMYEPIKILLKNSEIAVELIKQYYINVETEDLKFETLLDLYSFISTSQTIIFCNTVEKVNWLKENLEKNNFVIAFIHGKMTQEERDNVIKDFKEGKSRILLTTDLLSRGIDIPLVNMVINYDLPSSKEVYIHRIGRCGRFDKKGIAISMIKMEDPSDIKLFHRMRNFYKIKIEEIPDNIDKLLKF
jgi:superfamily II DNA/RNA helicase